MTLADMMNHRARVAPTKLAGWAGRLVEKAPPTSAARNIAESTAAEALSALVRSGRCCRCGRKLTDPASVEAGIGDDCAKRMGSDYVSTFIRRVLAAGVQA